MLASGLPDRPGRRGVLLAGGAGLAAAATSAVTLWPGAVSAEKARPDVVRPPGALPEPAFLDRCMRCGNCAALCPTNAIQPIWFESGAWGVFSPKLDPDMGPCSPNCNACGASCPTGAIRDLPLAERRWARPGVAVITTQRCLAWEWDRKCMVCDEVCPYGAIEFVPGRTKNVPVPRVRESRCAGCGSCENHCPANRAITVNGFGALRLASGSYVEMGRKAGLSISLKKQKKVAPLAKDEMPPGFDP